MNTTNLIDRLEQILPGIQNSNSQAEDAMVEALPLVIAEMKRLATTLQTISNWHIPDQPAANDCDAADYARQHHTGLRLMARKALESSK